MKHINIPIFIPHLGCPNQCVFCNQRYISGTEKFDIANVDIQIEEVLSSAGADHWCEIAFFGGSFTGIDRELMICLLDKAQGYVDDGRVHAIRLSTRPDYINDDIITILKKYSISAVELGIQSFNDTVLSKCKRGHTVKDTLRAIELLRNANISFVGQMMIGLPGSTPSDEILCAQKICELGAIGSRIYPTIVFKYTELEFMLNSNEYIPLDFNDAVERSARALDVFVQNKVKCLRVGLCDSENLHSTDTYVAGPNLPSIGELVMSRLYLNKVLEKLGNISCEELKGKILTIFCSKNLNSQVIGNKKSNIKELLKRYFFKNVVVKENSMLQAYEIEIFLEGGKA